MKKLTKVQQSAHASYRVIAPAAAQITEMMRMIYLKGWKAGLAQKRRDDKAKTK